MKFLVTGAASGIGRAVVQAAMQDEGADASFVLADLDGERLDELAHLASTAGARVLAMRADVADPAACEALGRHAVAELGGLDALVSNAGSNLPAAPLTELDVAAFDRLFALNTRATWLLGRAVHGALSQSRGAIVATASTAADHPVPPLGSYSASKAALVMLVRQMALEWGPDGIRCNCVSPGPTDTGMTRAAFGNPDSENRARRESFIPLRRIGAAEDVARAILFLAGPQARQITGVNLMVDGGLSTTLMPATGGGQGYARPR